MITSRRSYRLLRVLEGGSRRPVLVHLCLDRDRSNLALARRELAAVQVGEFVPAVSIPEQGPPPAATPIDDPPAPVSAPAVPLPRRAAVRRPPAALPAPARDEVPTVLTPVLAQQWSTDVTTLRRLLGALRAMT